MDDLLAAGFRLNAPAGPDATAASLAGTGGHRQDHDQGDDVVALRRELAAARHGRQLAAPRAVPSCARGTT